MARTALIVQFQIELSDVDRQVYETFELRVAQHPSESDAHLVSRLIAWCLCADPMLSFGTGGVSRSDEPTLWIRDHSGIINHWIEVGTPSAERLHKASKASNKVSVFSHKDPSAMMRDAAKKGVHLGEQVSVYKLAPSTITELTESLSRKNTWQVLHHDGLLSISIGQSVYTIDALPLPLVSL